jgi:hypothetical protein
MSAPRRPCSNCPWRLDAPPEKWHRKHFRRIWRNCQDDGLSMMLCHKAPAQPTAAEREGMICQGWARVVGTDAIGVRLALMQGLVSPCEVADRGGPPLHASFAEMMRANLVRPPARNVVVPPRGRGRR